MTVLLTAIGLAASGCAQSEGEDPDRAGTDITVPIVFAAVASVEEGACSSGEADAYESRLDDGTRCVFIDPEEFFEAESGSASLVAASESTPETPESIELVLGEAAPERLSELTGAIVGQAPPRNQMVIAVEGEIVAMPSVMAQISGGTVSIVGDGLANLYDKITA